jgi:NitT/TauT family transport system permease protein
MSLDTLEAPTGADPAPTAGRVAWPRAVSGSVSESHPAAHPAARPAARPIARLRRLREPALSFGLLAALLGLWWLATARLGVQPFVLPPPADVIGWLVKGFALPYGNPASLWYHTAVTIQEAVAGFVLGATFGIVGGMALAHWTTAERVLSPFIVAFQSLPKIAIAPLLVVWFGFGMEAKVITATIITFFPLLVAAITGYHSVEPDRIDLARSCNATPAQIFWKIILPSSLPFVFAGLHVGVVMAILGAITGEFVGAQAGLGLLLLQYNNDMQVGGVFSILFLLGAFGFVLNFLMRRLEARFCFWARRGKTFN